MGHYSVRGAVCQWTRSRVGVTCWGSPREGAVGVTAVGQCSVVVGVCAGDQRLVVRSFIICPSGKSATSPWTPSPG